MKLTIEEVNRLGKDEFVAKFGTLFEHSPWVAEGAWRGRPFEELAGLHGAFVGAMRGASSERQLNLIRVHPDLAGKAAIAGELTAESAREQSSAGLDRLSPQEYEDFKRMNREYREKFGFPMIVCVREHTKETILAQAGERLEHSRDEEIEVALEEISKITHLRLEDLVEPSHARGAAEKGDPR